MLLTYFRSSSYNTFDSCQMQYFLEYVLGFEKKSGRAAAKGNCVHKALEVIALRKKRQQENIHGGFEEENLGYLSPEDCEPDSIIEKSFDWHKANFDHDWDDRKDLKDCRTWMWIILNDPIYDPRKRHIIEVEQKFDFEIRQPWAEYHYELDNGKVLDGYLSLKGTMDLVTETRPNCLEIIDWKTGATMKDFATGKLKTFESLGSDSQLRIYHYACHQIFPNKDDITMTIYFPRVKGPFSIMLGKEDLADTEKMIRAQFEKIRKTVKPELTPGPSWSDNPNPYLASYKCYKLCDFAKPSKFDPTKSTCKYIKEQIEKIGIDEVTNRFGDLSKIDKYTGGGRYQK